MSGSTASPTACYIDAFGIHSPNYQDILTYLQTSMRTIYGTDIYLGNDSQDQQLLGIVALAITDTNSTAVAVYNSYSPTTAQGVGLDSIVKVNGIARLVPTHSQVSVIIAGAVGTPIHNGAVYDEAGLQWSLPASVVIPLSGAITVTVTCNTAGANQAAPNTLTKIATPTYGWQSVTNPQAATAGSPLESDAALRVRQNVSTEISATALGDALQAAIANIPGVTQSFVYENDGYAVDANTLPPHSIAVVVDGGDAQTIFNTIYRIKAQGSYTYGDNIGTVFDVNGTPRTIRFFRPTEVLISIYINIVPLPGYTTVTGTTIVAAVVNYVNQLVIGNDVVLTRLYVPANLTGIVSNTFKIQSILLSRNSGILNAADVLIAFNEVAKTTSALTTINTATS